MSGHKLDVSNLVETHQAGVWRYLRVLGCDEAQAEDLTQETFIVVLSKPFEDYDRRATAAYLRKTARYLYLSAIRKAARRAEIENSEMIESVFATSDQEADAAEAVWLANAADTNGETHVDALRACLEKTDERSRKAIELRYGQERTRKEIAGVLGMSEEGTKTLFRRIRDNLRNCISRRLGR